MTHAMHVIDDALARADAPCLTSSFQADGVVLTHMLRERRPDLPILFLDTLHHFRETLEYRDALARRWNLNVLTLRAAEPRVGLLHVEGTQACCARHKVEPLFAALDAYDVWFTALRRAQSPSRAGLQAIEPFRLPSGTVLQRVSPLADWSSDDVRTYAEQHGIPLLPLYARGYTSIGCEPCTSVPADPGNPRSGRWRGETLECGIHIQPHETGASAPHVPQPAPEGAPHTS